MGMLMHHTWLAQQAEEQVKQPEPKPAEEAQETEKPERKMPSPRAAKNPVRRKASK